MPSNLIKNIKLISKKKIYKIQATAISAAGIDAAASSETCTKNKK